MAEHDELSPILIEDKILKAGFVQVPVAVVFDPDLSTGAKTMYGALLWYAWQFGGAPAQSVMAKALGAGRATVQRHIYELEKQGYLETRVVGLGKPNEYVIKSLHNRQFPGAPEMMHPVHHKQRTKGTKNDASHRTTSDRTTQTLSHSADLADAFFAAIGESRPSAKRRERACKIIDDLTAEGFDADAIREACRLAGERGAKGPDLLPHLVGEAAEIVARRGQARKRAEQVQEAAATADRQHQADTSAVDALSASERARYEQQAREALRIPQDRDSAVVQGAVTGWIAARLRGGG